MWKRCKLEWCENVEKKKGISADEKRSLLLEIFHETKEFFQLKDLEKIAAKDKGLKEQVVKEILEALVDEGLVETGKIGSSHYYWSFPAKKRKLKQQEFDHLRNKIDESAGKIEELLKRIDAKKTKEECSRSTDVFEKLKALKEKERQVATELKKIKPDDGKSTESMNNALPGLHDAANRWTDNIFSIKSWCKKRFNIQENLLDKQFQIPSDLDYLE